MKVGEWEDPGRQAKPRQSQVGSQPTTVLAGRSPRHFALCTVTGPHRVGTWTWGGRGLQQRGCSSVGGWGDVQAGRQSRAR